MRRHACQVAGCQRSQRSVHGARIFQQLQGQALKLLGVLRGNGGGADGAAQMAFGAGLQGHQLGLGLAAFGGRVAVQQGCHHAGQARVQRNLLEAFVARHHPRCAAAHDHQRHRGRVGEQGPQGGRRCVNHHQAVGPEVGQQAFHGGSGGVTGLAAQVLQPLGRRNHGERRRSGAQVQAGTVIPCGVLQQVQQPGAVVGLLCCTVEHHHRVAQPLQAGADLPQRFESIRRVALAGDRQQPQLRLRGEAVQAGRLMKTQIKHRPAPLP